MCGQETLRVSGILTLERNVGPEHENLNSTAWESSNKQPQAPQMQLERDPNPSETAIHHETPMHQ